MKKILFLFVLAIATFQANAQLVISEILYNRITVGGGGGGVQTLDSLQFIEIWNSGTADINLQNYRLANAVVDTFPDYVLGPKEYYVVALNANFYAKTLGKPANRQWKSGNLPSTNQQAKRIDLYDFDDKFADSVRYRVNAPWPATAPVGGGGGQVQNRYSIVYCDATKDNGVGTSWYLSQTNTAITLNNALIYASPGAADCPVVAVDAKNLSLSTYKGINLQIPANTLTTTQGATTTVTKTTVNGTLNRQGQNFTYVPKAGFCGKDSFEYTVNVTTNVAKAKVLIDVICNILYKSYSIGTVTKDENSNFIPDSLGLFVELKGVVHSPNFGTSPQIQFCIIDEKTSEDGIFVVKAQPVGYPIPKIGDKVTVKGRIVQAQGLTVINPDTIFVTGTNAKPFAPKVVSLLDESTEAALVQLKGLKLKTPAQWGTTVGGGGGGGGAAQPTGYQLDVTDGVSDFVMFIDKDIEDLFYFAGPKTATFDIIGIGTQIAQAAGGGGGGGQMLNTGYRILPRQFSDMKIYVNTNDEALGQMVKVYPNPMNDVLNVLLSENVDKITISNALGQVVYTTNNPTTTNEINTNNWLSGVYMMKIEKEGREYTQKLVK